jgi:hypothetical protein
MRVDWRDGERKAGLVHNAGWKKGWGTRQRGHDMWSRGPGGAWSGGYCG